MEGPDEKGRRDTNRCSKQNIEDQHRGAFRIRRQWCEVGWDIEGRLVAKESLRQAFRAAGVAFPNGAPWTRAYTGGSANLWAPVVINTANLRAVQAVGPSQRYSHIHPVGEAWEPVCS